MIHHVSLEVDKQLIAEERLFWSLLGFHEMMLPSRDRRGIHWLVNRETQTVVHLMPSEWPTIPEFGHTAVIPPDFSRAIAGLCRFGSSPEQARDYFGRARVYIKSPSGHQVEALAGAPPVKVGMPLEGSDAR